MKNESKLGIYDLSGPAVERLRRVVDDNHAETADEAVAMANFDGFSDSLYRTQRAFLGSKKLAE
ncbi:hypothetical protein [Hoeflea olei]|uniref:Uncharacterized protein n=1 Tax=Hoeflea olei TaxID=1480615 RepID=A0A1C1YZZ7_9HYPH|nr:hypothetical protein [Hoeflea olei]OCW58999.1 hypothetical protein AWJ14_04615 [Hoeflea olei]